MRRQAARSPGRGSVHAGGRPFAAFGDVHVELLPRAPYEARYTPTAAVIGFAFETQAGLHAFASDRATIFRTMPNSLAYVPAGCEVMSRSEAGGEYMTVRLGVQAEAMRPTERRFNDHVDPAAIAAAQNLRRMLLAREPVDLLLFEAEVANLRDAAGRALAGHARPPLAARWMTARRLRAIDELIEARLEARLTVGELAARLGLSRGFFTRAFQAAVGKAPHDYVIDRRLSRARMLLRTTDCDLADIAAACGFSSHAHMTAQFCRRLGAAPRHISGR